MTNMSYCRFENTLKDLEDCQNHIDDNDLVESESNCRDALIELCVEIALDYGYSVNRPVIEEEDN